MIPCIAIPVLNRPDLLKRCIDSIDFPAELLIIDNGKVVPHGWGVPSSIQTVHLETPPANLGVAGSWNMTMDIVFNKGNKDAVLICGNDIQWLPGQLEIFWQTWDANRDACFLYAYWSYSTFMVTRKGFDTIGWFDENFAAYLEDSDHWWRVNRYKKLGVDIKTVDVPVRPVHGESPHWGSSTLYSDPVVAKQVKEGHARGWSYYCSKWGGQIAGNTERFDTPFNDPGIPVNAWKLGADRLRQPHYRSQS